MHRHANIAVCFPRNAVFTTKLNYDVNVVDSARVAHVREGRVLGVSRATAYSTNASRGLSAIAEFLMFLNGSRMIILYWLQVKCTCTL